MFHKLAPLKKKIKKILFYSGSKTKETDKNGHPGPLPQAATNVKRDGAFSLFWRGGGGERENAEDGVIAQKCSSTCQCWGGGRAQRTSVEAHANLSRTVPASFTFLFSSLFLVDVHHSDHPPSSSSTTTLLVCVTNAAPMTDCAGG